MEVGNHHHDNQAIENTECGWMGLPSSSRDSLLCIQTGESRGSTLCPVPFLDSREDDQATSKPKTGRCTQSVMGVEDRRDSVFGARTDGVLVTMYGSQVAPQKGHLGLLPCG